MASRKVESKARGNHIRVRLRPTPSPAVEVTLDDAELAAIDKAVDKHQLDGRSALFRAIGWVAAAEHASSLDAEDTFRAAAKSAHMGIGEWLRWITLGAIGESDFCAQVSLAQEAVKTGKLSS